MEKLEKIHVCKVDPSKELQIGHELKQPIQGKVLKFLQQNLDVFTWNHEDMKRIDPITACHRLRVDPSVRRKLQKRRPLNPESMRF